MTDEDRQKLCERLRAGSWGETPTRKECDKAADEIERLMGEVENWKLWARSQPGYPNQQRSNKMAGKEQLEISEAVTDLVKDAKGMSERQLAAAIQDLINTTAEQTADNLYRGEQSASAGLIEAAEQARDLLNGRHNVGSDAYKASCILNAAISRARAAD